MVLRQRVEGWKLLVVNWFVKLSLASFFPVLFCSMYPSDRQEPAPIPRVGSIRTNQIIYYLTKWGGREECEERRGWQVRRGEDKRFDRALYPPQQITQWLINRLNTPLRREQSTAFDPLQARKLVYRRWVGRVGIDWRSKPLKATLSWKKDVAKQQNEWLRASRVGHQLYEAYYLRIKGWSFHTPFSRVSG